MGDADVLQLVILVEGIEIALTGHARKTPEVLVFKVRAVAPTENLEGYQVVALLQIGSDVKLSRHLGILSISHELAIHVKIDIGSDAAEMGYDLLARPILWNGDDTAITAHVVFAHGHERSCHGEALTPAEAHVHVLGIAISVHFPDARHGHGVPAAVIQVGLVEIIATTLGILRPVEFPVALQREIVGGAGLVISRHGLGLIGGIGEETGVEGESVDGVHLHVVPLGALGIALVAVVFTGRQQESANAEVGLRVLVYHLSLYGTLAYWLHVAHLSIGLQSGIDQVVPGFLHHRLIGGAVQVTAIDAPKDGIRDEGRAAGLWSGSLRWIEYGTSPVAFRLLCLGHGSGHALQLPHHEPMGAIVSIHLL